MSGVWLFNNVNGVMRLVDGAEAMEGGRHGSGGRRKVLVHTASNEIITSYAILERKLYSLGWERYYDDPDLLQFHKHSTIDLISLPMDFNRFKSMHMYNIVVKNKHSFEVRDMMMQVNKLTTISPIHDLGIWILGFASKSYICLVLIFD
jgi:hypothetical protein